MLWQIGGAVVTFRSYFPHGPMPSALDTVVTV
jgi:hypothetical protein